MKLEYKGVNQRGRVEWIDMDYYDPSKPFEGFELEEWQLPRYRELVEVAESSMGRKLTKDEARTMNWLSSSDLHTCQHILQSMKEAYENHN